MRHARTAAGVVGLLLALAACSSGTSTPSAAPTSAADTTSSQPPATCNLTSKADIYERVVAPGQPATAQRLGSVNLALCKLTFDTLAQTTSTDPGFCAQAAWVSDNVGYNPDAVPAPRLKKVQVAIGDCG